MPPLVTITVPANTVVTSPDTLLCSVYVFDADGLEFLRWSLRNATGSLLIDSTQAIAGVVELTRVLSFAIPPDLPSGTLLGLAVRATDAAGYTGRDSVAFTIP